MQGQGAQEEDEVEEGTGTAAPKSILKRPSARTGKPAPPVTSYYGEGRYTTR